MSAERSHIKKERVDDRILQLAGTQLGVVTRQQLRGLGLSDTSITYRVRCGLLERIYAGIFRVSGFPKTWNQGLVAAYLWGGKSCVVSHRSAGRVLGLDACAHAPYEVSTTKQSAPRA